MKSFYCVLEVKCELCESDTNADDFVGRTKAECLKALRARGWTIGMKVKCPQCTTPQKDSQDE